MWNVSQRWLDALTTSHGLYIRMEAWQGGVSLGTIPLESGHVQVTAKSRIRRTLDVVVPEDRWPSGPNDILAPYGTQLRVWRGILGVNGSLIDQPVPVFTGRIETIRRDRMSGLLAVTALDPFANVNDAQFESPRVPQAGVSVVNTIAGLVREVVPNAMVVDETNSPATIPTGISWDTDRGQAIDDLAASIGAEVFFQPDGMSLVIRPVPNLTGTPVWTLYDGFAGILIRDTYDKSRTDVANRWIVHVERPGSSPLLVTATDTDPNSPTRYNGPYGPVVRHYSNPLITSTSQGLAAGVGRLARSAGLARTRQVTCVPNPALEAGDLFVVSSLDSTERHIADDFPVGLSASDSMVINTRSTTDFTNILL